MRYLSHHPYVLAVLTTASVYLAFFFFKKIFFSQVERIIRRTDNRLDDVLIYGFAHTSHVFMIVCAGYIGFQLLPERRTYPTWAWRIFFTVLMVQIAIWGNYTIRKWMQLSFSRRRKRDPASASSINILELMVKVSFLALILIFTLHNLGIKVTTMLTGLGISGIALALALQNILGDLFSSLSIILDKPFVVGDFIIVGDFLGEVETIGLKTTRIRSLHGEQVIMSNSDLLGSRIRNMKRLRERRISHLLLLPHELTPTQIRRAVEIVSAVVQSKEQIRLDRCHFLRVGHSALELEVVWWVLSDDFNRHMDLQQKILLDVHQIFREEGIAYAYPVQRQVREGLWDDSDLPPPKTGRPPHALR